MSKLILGAWLIFGSVMTGEEVALGVDKIAEQVRPSLLTVINAGRDGYAQGLGTGFVISRDGLVVTNLHVVGEARPIQVELQDGRRPKITEIVGWSRKDDLIIFRMEAVDVPPLKMGPGTEMPQGTAVVAMGNPLGLRYSVVQGIVSALREVEGQSLIQLAMPIERGNSGGPLVDTDGQLRGVINMKSAVTDNLGYAIPVATLQAMLAHPAPVKMEHWLTIGQLNPKLWHATDTTWRQRAGRILAQGAGEGFGGRTNCFFQAEAPALPYEVSVRVKFSDSSGAAGLAFCGDGADTHYGFYPTNGNLRLTRFEGPEQSEWSILKDAESAAYRPGEWNLLRVRVEEQALHCFVNGVEVITFTDGHLRGARAGVCKFRQTEPEFKDFHLGPDLATARLPADGPALEAAFAAIAKADIVSPAALHTLSVTPEATQEQIETEAAALEKRLQALRSLGHQIHEESVRVALQQALAKPEAELNLAESALLIAKLDNPELVVTDYLLEIDRLAAEFRAALAPEEHADSLPAARHLVRWFCAEHGFHGSQEDFESKSNSYLNEVMDDREGLPITLCVLCLEIAQRVGIPLEGIPFPSRFLIQYRSPAAAEPGPCFDLFENGKEMTAADLASISPVPTPVPPPASKTAILVRMLHNLIGGHPEATALPYLNLLLTIDPAASDDRLTRASLLFRAHQLPAARADVQWLINHPPAGTNPERLELLLQSLPR